MPKISRNIRLQRPCKFVRSDKAQGSAVGWTSSNWSGYAQSGRKGAYNRVSANWTVPSVIPSAQPVYSSAWVGIDGYNNTSLIQTGTAHDFANGVANYYAWWEILPAAETVIPYAVHPGDRMRAVIAKLNHGKWSISLRNLTRGWRFRTVQAYKGPQTSAEWIVEAPQVGGSISTLARLTPVVFSCCRVNGRNPRLKLSQRGIMIQNGKKVSIPTRPNRAGDAFLVKGRRL
ncbi:G1 family glutamic endopeptidase [Cohnella rhizosphaerae]|uniref:G1 family endopeptidase n=1 Tax=Cohnella rhizosphaerae TaxID=1457232 RepID=A0A9X4QUA0_9BACL|nr:G1 family glutamic endopeptidase [Cohnella rhizosphaerae]MDG0812051.1 G1 family endopeptidase [Cohnella rhizosphaerae]